MSVESPPVGPLSELLGGRLAHNLQLAEITGSVSTAERLTLLVEVTDGLREKFGALGVRWWLEHPSDVLGGRTPVDLLTNGDCEQAHQVRTLVRSMAA